jgi:orotate phosphoribosyltransferase
MFLASLSQRIQETICVSGHFLLSSGLHSLVYVDKRKLSKELLSQAGEYMAFFADDTVQIVVSPAEGAIPLGKQVAEHLTNLMERKVDFVAAQKDKNSLFFFSSEDQLKLSEKRVLVVEDVFTTGNSVKKVTRLVRFFSANVVGVSALWNRGEVTAEELGIPWFHSIINKAILAQDPGVATCSACREGISLNTGLGHG